MRSRRWPFVLASVLLLGCPDRGDRDREPQRATLPDVDLAGRWAGTWSGLDPRVGSVTGNWEAEVTQTDDGVRATFLLTGDVDCPDGTLEGGLDAAGALVGTIQRPPCPHNEWTMTALNLAERTTTGVWTQPGREAHGTFTGTQIAKAGAVRVAFVHPPGGRPGALVTIAVEGHGGGAPLLDFAGIPGALTGDGASGILRARVPEGATTGPVYVTESGQTSLSARPFDVDVSSPRHEVSAMIHRELGASGEGVGVSPDGRKAYVANGPAGSVSMIDTRTGMILATTSTAAVSGGLAQGIAVGPDSRHVYVASGAGVVVLTAATAAVAETLAVPRSDGRASPQGIALGPDGRTLYVAGNAPGGAFTVVDLASRAPIASVPAGSGATPLAAAASPDGRTAFLTFSGGSAAGPGEVRIFDLPTRTVTGAVPVGVTPAGLAVAPDGATVFVANEGDGTVTALDVATLQTSSIPVGSSPQSVAVSPDGRRAWVPSRVGRSIAVLDVASGALTATIPLDCEPVGVAMAPDGKRAYATCAGSGVVELGGPKTLTIAKDGPGIGTVTSSPEGIVCGASCQARFDPGTVVTLTASADAGSYFQGWSAECAGGTVTLSASRTCTATFGRNASSGGGGGSDMPNIPPGGEEAYCFIATAAFGSPMAPEVRALREFRDRHLATHAPGRAFIRAYYAVSPPAARFIARHHAARWLARRALAPLVWAVARPTSAGMAVLAIAALAALAAHRTRTAAERSGR